MKKPIVGIIMGSQSDLKVMSEATEILKEFGIDFVREDGTGKRATITDETMDAGLNNTVKDNDNNFPPEWRLSRSGRRQPE